MKQTTLDLIKNINENTFIPATTQNELFELFQLDTVADLRKVSRNFMKVYELLEHFDDQTSSATNEKKGIVKLGTETGASLEGNRLAEIIGLEFGGNIQDTGNKEKGKFYYDNVTKYYYECIADTSATYNDATKFRAISNKPISDKMENLFSAGLIKSSDGRGIKLYAKATAMGNTLNISDTFSEAIFVLISPYKSYPSPDVSYVVSYQKFQDGKIFFNSTKFVNGRFDSYNFSEKEDATKDYGSCMALVYGVLK